MTTTAKCVLIGMACLISLTADASEYTLQLIVGKDAGREIVTAGQYNKRHQCELVRNQYRLGSIKHKDLTRPVTWAECLPCREFKELCQEGI